jgi:DNA-binding NtrC family response regulator
MTAPDLLVVDDDRDIRNSIKEILELEGFNIDLAASAQETIEKTKNKFYNVILLDIKLPDMDGTALLTRLTEISPKTIKIMVTGFPSLENAVKALNFGANAYLVKPVDPEKLIQIVQEKLTEQAEHQKIDENKVNEWIESRVRQLERDIKD